MTKEYREFFRLNAECAAAEREYEAANEALQAARKKLDDAVAKKNIAWKEYEASKGNFRE